MGGAGHADIHTVMGLAQLIESRKQDVLGRWKEMVRTLSGSTRRLSEESLEDHVPPLIDWLVRRLREHDEADVHGSQRLSRVHAFQRQDDFDLVEVLAGNSRCCATCCSASGSRSPGDVAPAEVLRLNRDLDDVVTVCTTEFARQVVARYCGSRRRLERSGLLGA